VLPFGEEQAAFDLHERGCHDEEVARDFEVELLHGVQRGDVLAGDRLDGDVVNIELVFSNEKKEQVERAFKDRQLDAIIGFRNHGADASQREGSGNFILGSRGSFHCAWGAVADRFYGRGLVGPR